MSNYLYVIFVFCFFFFTACQTTKKKPDPVKEVKETVKEENLNSRSHRWLQSQNEQFQINKTWWTALGDAELNKLIEQVISQNLDLQIMTDRLKLASVAIKEAKVQKDPRLSFDAGGQLSKTDGLGTSKQFTAAASAGWEIDIWGRISKMTDSQLAEYKATEADWRSAYLQTIKQLTDSYFTLRQLDEQKELHNEALSYARSLLKIYSVRVKNKIEDDSNMSRQKAEVLRLESELLDINKQRLLQENQINILLGKAPGAIKLEEKSLRKSVKPVNFPNDISLNLLERRPDIVAAELRVQSDYQLVESTEAARLPRISLGLTANLANESITNLLTGWTAALLPKVSFPSLDPQTKLNIEKAGINLEITKKQYFDTVNKAIADVEKSLLNKQTNDKRIEIEKKRLLLLENAHKKIVVKEREGLISSLELLQSQQQLLSTKQQILAFYAQQMQDTVAIYNALGGGW